MWVGTEVGLLRSSIMALELSGNPGHFGRTCLHCFHLLQWRYILGGSAATGVVGVQVAPDHRVNRRDSRRERHGLNRWSFADVEIVDRYSWRESYLMASAGPD